MYLYPGKHNPDAYDLWSLGPDGVESDDDIGNWEN
jgi:general secretion pathway protein G